VKWADKIILEARESGKYQKQYKITKKGRALGKKGAW
jgi:predicted transcriptional regulator